MKYVDNRQIDRYKEIVRETFRQSERERKKDKTDRKRENDYFGIRIVEQERRSLYQSSKEGQKKESEEIEGERRKKKNNKNKS